MDWLDLLAVQGTLNSLFEHHSSKASILRFSVFFTVQLSHPYMITGKTITLTRQTFVQEVFLSLCRQLSPAEAAVCQASKGKNEMIFHGHPDLSLINEIMKYLYFSYHITWEWVVGQNKQKGK